MGHRFVKGWMMPFIQLEYNIKPGEDTGEIRFSGVTGESRFSMTTDLACNSSLSSDSFRRLDNLERLSYDFHADQMGPFSQKSSELLRLLDANMYKCPTQFLVRMNIKMISLEFAEVCKLLASDRPTILKLH